MAPASSPLIVPRGGGSDGLIDEGDPLAHRWLKYSLRLAAGLTVVLTAGFLAIDARSGRLTPLLLFFHLLRIGPALIFLSLIDSRWFERHWRIATVLAATPMLFASEGLGWAGGTAESFVYGAVILLMATAAVVPWSTSWHTLLTLIAVVGLVIDGYLSPDRAHLAGDWIELLGAAGLGYCINLVSSGYRRELSEQLQTLRTILATSPESIGLADLQTGCFLEVGNPELLGYTRDEAVGAPPNKLRLWVHQAEAREYLRRLKYDGVVHNMEAAVRKKDGSVIPVLISGARLEINGRAHAISVTREITEIKQVQDELLEAREQLAAQVTALRDSQGRLRAEILERENAQQQLQHNEASIRKIFETALQAITINRLSDGAFVGVNREFERKFGYAPEEIIGKSAAAAGMWPENYELHKFLRVMRHHGESRNREFELRTKDGRLLPIRTSAVVVDYLGEPCIVGFSQDISEQRQAQREIEAAREAALAASKAKSDFLSSMSHEIRTPLNAIIGMADVLSETALNEEQRRYVATMQGNSTALLDLINGILDLAKVESGRLTLEKAEFDLRPLVEGVLDTLSIRAFEKQLELAAHIELSLFTRVMGDQLRLRQILLNLIGNAIKFTSSGSITLRVTADAPAVGGNHSRISHSTSSRCFHFAVTDTGIGIAQEKIGELFSPFTQADSSTARKYGGSGLGLAIVKRLIDQMGGSIEVVSELGTGSTFNFMLPLEIASIDSPAQRNDPQLLKGHRALIADALEINRAIIAEVLTRHGLDVTEVADGSRAAALANSNSADSFDLVFLDWCLKGTDAFALGRSFLEKTTRQPPASVIMMITPDRLGERLTTLRDLTNGSARRLIHLVKPLKSGEIEEIVRSAAGSFENFVPATADSEQSTLPARAPDPACRPLRILVADDSPDNRMLIAAYLKHLPHQLSFAEDGQIAIARLQAETFDLVLMDIQMPVVDGYTAAQTIRAWEREHRRERTPIAALTAAADDEAVRLSIAAGCDTHVSKPVRKATLLRLISEFSEPDQRAANLISAIAGG